MRQLPLISKSRLQHVPRLIPPRNIIILINDRSLTKKETTNVNFSLKKKRGNI